MLGAWAVVIRRALFTRHVWAHVGISLLVVATLVASAWVTATSWLFDTALVVHLLGLTVSLGAVLVIDWTGLAWLGLTALLTSGLFLAPDLTRPATWLKVVAVLLLANNGLVVEHIERQMRALPRMVSREQLPPAPHRRVVGSIVASHLGWWSAVAVGVLTMLERR